MSTRKPKTLVVRCSNCGRAERFPVSSPAAPELSAAEAAGEAGWAFSVDFWAMLTGDHRAVCPECIAGRAQTETARARQCAQEGSRR